ncbi:MULTISPECIES: DUF4123 domain-containing protein [unclassified Gilliamella]|uniref:DUF4123 domain-containing protein n=1 Tax=unclassified Gilliamella TaxID=2685620 RepID=UPI002269A3D7|nr:MULTISPECIES: DUF4123 domain-containing protein [unclassified Gilliamella]MCX8641055.1 hypothetical protein [Gilliamella sp. B3835]MCX8707994.1 hypothetical protein [Gilliamella sp. B3783]MCX8710169.1 hypothetical protein [Gilliamella sp. B3780]MCX8714974.1 hypothetical protein [Gilliamella sp. B3781]MCX8716977.1 hypothetical protein [Gilliamella sp. B3784]
MLKNGQIAIDLSKLSANALAISQQLITLSQPFQWRCLVILDPFLNPINQSLIQYYKNRLRLHQIVIMHSSVLAIRRPWLIELDLRDKYDYKVLSYMLNVALTQLTPESINAGNGQQYCAWLFTHKDIVTIANNIASLSLQQRDNKKILLRYYDPAVFFQLKSLFNTKQQNKLLNDIKIWTMLGRDGHLKIHYNENEFLSLSINQLGITHEQYQQIDCIGINNQIILSHNLKNPDIHIDEVQSLQIIMPCLQRLKIKNIYDRDLYLEWARLALEWGQDFDLIPKIAEKTQHLLLDHQYYPLVRELTALSQQDWLALERN